MTLPGSQKPAPRTAPVGEEAGARGETVLRLSGRAHGLSTRSRAEGQGRGVEAMPRRDGNKRTE